MNLHGMSFTTHGDGSKILVSYYTFYFNYLRFTDCDDYDYGGGDCSVFEQLKCYSDKHIDSIISTFN